MQTETMVVGSSLWDWMIVLLSATLIAQGIQYVQCAESPLSWPLPALRPVLKAAVDITNNAIAVVAAAFSSPRSLPRTVRRRHEREREKRAARELKRSNSAKFIANRASAKQTAAVGAQPLPPVACNHDDEGRHSQAVSKACSKAKSNLKATAGAQVTTCYFVNYVSSTDNNLLCHEVNEAKPAAAPCDTPLDAPHDGAHKLVVVHTPPQRDEPTDQESKTAAHDEDKWQIEDLSQGIFVRGVLAYAFLSAGIVSLGVAQGSQSAGGWASSADGAGKGRSSRGSSGNNKKGPVKRKRDHDDGRDEKKRNGPGPSHRHDDEGDWDGRFLACPYYKMDPHRYSRCLAKYELKRFADVKQHLIRCHKVNGYYCSRCCLVEFEDRAAWQLHSQSCNVPNTALRPENFTDDEIEYLANAPRGATDERKYYWVWEHFFFEHPAPASPYVRGYLPETRSVHVPDFQAGLQTALLSPTIDIERGEGEDRTAWVLRLNNYLGTRVPELASQAEHPRRLRFPPSDAHAHAHAAPPHANHLHAHAHANRPAVALQQPQQPLQPPSQPQPHPPHQPQPVAPAHAPAAAGLFPTVAHELQVPPLLPPHHQTSLPNRAQRSPAAARADSAAASPSGVATTISPSLLNMGMGMGMNMYYQNPQSQPQLRQRSHRPALPSQTPALDQEEIPIDPNLSYHDPPPPAPQGQTGNINQPANTDLSHNDDDDDFDYGAFFSLP